MRGANPGETLVLIDGIRIGDSTATDGSVDFGNLSVTDIERIEVLRGPQSALYGSDAMGGVINIITRKGRQDATTHRECRGRQLRHAVDTRARCPAATTVGPIRFASTRSIQRRLSALRLSHRPADRRSATA